jgi:hypothetical protein
MQKFLDSYRKTEKTKKDAKVKAAAAKKEAAVHDDDDDARRR